MSTAAVTEAVRASAPASKPVIKDATGRDRMAWNVLTTWGAHLVFIVAGFLMPRLIDRRLGQVSLGVWDFGWSLVSYFALAQVGVGSSVNRYVAKFRALGDVEGLRRTVSSVNVIQMASTALALTLTIVLTWLLPTFFGERLGMEVSTARWTILLLGSAVAVQLAFNAFGGVLTGCHRWDIHNGVTSGAYGVIVCGMITVLTLGGGLRELSAVYLLGTLGGEVVRMLLAYRVCPELRVHPRLATWADIRMLLVFGGKTVVDNLARLLLTQANAILVATHLGPGALAVYARPGALVRHTDTLTNKFSMLLSPAASSLKSTDRLDELRHMFIQATRFAAFVAMPVTVFLALMGDLILHVWMGPRYGAGALMAVIAIGNFLPLTQRPSNHVLIGLNRHGRVGWASFAVAWVGVAAAALALGPFHGGLVSAALSLVVPYSVGNGLFVMVYACRSVGVPLLRYLRLVFLPPLAWAVPLSASLLAVRFAFGDSPGLALAAGLGVSIALLAPVYWFVVLPLSVRQKVLSKAGRLLSRTRRNASPAVRPAVPSTPVRDVRASIQDEAEPLQASAAERVELRPIPFPYKAAIAICSDLDETPDSLVYFESMRFLNTTETTSMGPGVGLEVGNTMYFEMPPDQFAYWNTDEAGREMVRALIRSGHVDCLHSFGDLAATRADAGRALEDLDRHQCALQVWIDHAVAPTNFGADIMKGVGDLPGSPAYHADLTCAAGVRFVWRGRVTSVIGQNVPWSARGIARASQPGQSARTVAKEASKRVLAGLGSPKYEMHADNAILREASLRDGQPVYEFLRSNPHVGGVSSCDTASGVAEVLSARMLDRLAARGAVTIIYTHLGKIRSHAEPFGPAAREAFRHLARLRDERTMLVTTTRRLLGYSAALQRIEGTSRSGIDGATWIDLRIRANDRPLEPADLRGVTLYVSDPSRVRLFVEGHEAPTVLQNGPDETGRCSVTIPWQRLEFPGTWR
jgi:O-antigen/teichoic acid export membrane protein